MSSKVVAIVPAAGSGKRLGARQEKAFVRLGGKPLIVHTLKVLNSSACVNSIIIAVQASSIKRLKGIIKKYGIYKANKVTIGGKTRSESVKNCLDLLWANVQEPFFAPNCVPTNANIYLTNDQRVVGRN